MFKGLRVPAAALAVAGAALVLGNVGAFAYSSGSVGYDIGYPQCGTRYPNVARLAAAAPIARSGAWWSVAVQNPPASASTGLRTWYRPSYAFGIVGVDSGFPFMSSTHPGNPCLADEYNHAPQPGLYVNTGYDPIYKDANHTTSTCTMQSAAVAGNAEQQAAWAVGCSEANGDYTYASGKGINSAATWWLDVETGNSWCGQPSTACTDLSLNQYTIQGLIDTFTHIGAVPVGIYSNRTQWAAIVGNLPVTGVTSVWVASGTSTAQQAATYCSSSASFAGAPVSLVQFLGSSVDRDYAC
jgi:hypothetical protein